MGNDLLIIIKMGLESASIIFFLACCKVPSSNNASCVNDDAMEASIALFRAYLMKTVIPAINQTGHLMDYSRIAVKTVSPTRCLKNRSPSKSTDESSTSELAQMRTRDVKKETSKMYPVLLQDMRKLYRMINERTVSLLVLLFERLQILAQHVALDDQQVLLITNGAISTMEIECSEGAMGLAQPGRDPFSLTSRDSGNSVAFSVQIQLSGISLLACLFQRYSNHREVILEDIFPLMLKIPTQKKSMRSFAIQYTLCQAPNKVEELTTKLTLLPPPHTIQMMTSLILSLVQCCVTFPKRGNKSRISPLATGSHCCWNVADSLIQQLLQRCSTGKGDTASEFRPFLVRFVEDLLTVWILPDYPAAEMLLLSIIRRLTLEVNNATKNKCNQQTNFTQETTYINLAFDILAKVSVVQARALALTRNDPIAIISIRASRRDLMISCDSCYTFFKGASVDILSAECVPDEWYCDSCRLGSIALREQRKYDISLIDDRYVLQHAFTTSLTKSNGLLESENAIRLHLALWIEEIEKVSNTSDSQAKLIRDLCRHFNASRPSGPFGESLSNEGYSRLLLARMANSSFMLKSFRPQIAFLIRILSDETGAANGTNGLRKVSLKVIERICEADPSLMTSGIIIKAVSSRLTDDSISVREAALSLVGSFVVHTPVVAAAFHASLLGCLGDVGVSVRKRGVKIFQSILISNDTYEGRSEVYDSLFKLAANPKEEDVVRDLVHELFYNLWLTNTGEILNEYSRSIRGGSGEPSCGTSIQPANCVTPPTAVGESIVEGTKRRRSRADVAISQMIDVVRVGETGDHLYAMLSDLLETDENQKTDIDPSSNLLSHNSPGRRKSSGTAATLAASKRRSKFRLSHLHQDECTALLVSALFEALVSLEERRSIKSQEYDGKNLAAALQTIEVFAKLAPSRIFPHVDVLLPYLKADNGVPMEDESIIVGAVCDILFRLVSPISVVRDQAVYQERYSYFDPLAISNTVANDLVQISYKFGASALNSAVRVLVMLANLHFHDEDNPCVKACLTLARTFYSYLYKKASIPDLSKSDVSTVKLIFDLLKVGSQYFWMTVV
jgi:cohesin loading factor subunit SCC2